MARKIEMKCVKIELSENADKIDFVYADILKTVMKAQPQGGFTFDDMEKSLQIGKALNEVTAFGVGSYLILEEDQYDHLKKKMDAFRWGYSHEEILKLRDAVNNAKSFELAQEG